ncbi:DUF202 domain-containing protein [Pseudoxanthomonas sp. Soil82]|uniref:YidH family protein n=1 Tax=Pseudoxanthomonas sp. Soil82 TaxID=3157341 RepID=UPI00338DF7D3
MAPSTKAFERNPVDHDALPKRPQALPAWQLPPIPSVDASSPDVASVQYSAYRTQLSHHRTGLSDHRTDLSEYRTSLSEHRTDLSTDRTDMSMRRTGMSFQRTRLSAERTLMSVIRTSLSLIGFGFTIYQVLGKLLQAPGVQLGSHAPRNFGIALVALGIAMLVLGMVYHVNYMKELRAERNAMMGAGLVHGQTGYPVSFTLLTATALLMLGLLAIVSMVFGVAPFG